ncbi:MAG: hypothetical protein PHP26_01545 [Syntrophomonas sp.]|nr:hypothetical protein [Syntrophomonas sp.]
MPLAPSLTTPVLFAAILYPALASVKWTMIEVNGLLPNHNIRRDIEREIIGRVVTTNT